jgi:hypothetical protein
MVVIYGIVYMIPIVAVYGIQDIMALGINNAEQKPIIIYTNSMVGAKAAKAALVAAIIGAQKDSLG